MHRKLDVLADKGFVVLRDYDGPPIPAREWLDLEYMDWKSGGDTNFAPIASALGEMECAGFWDHGKPDKDGIWTKNAAQCPTLVQWVESVGANFGRVRIIKLNPNTEAEALTRNLHLDDNNRLNPDGEAWVVRVWLQITDDPDSYMILREDRDDPATESRISMPRTAYPALPRRIAMSDPPRPPPTRTTASLLLTRVSPGCPRSARSHGSDCRAGPPIRG